jgi:hypothetical protein
MKFEKKSKLIFNGLTWPLIKIWWTLTLLLSSVLRIFFIQFDDSDVASYHPRRLGEAIIWKNVKNKCYIIYKREFSCYSFSPQVWNSVHVHNLVRQKYVKETTIFPFHFSPPQLYILSHFSHFAQFDTNTSHVKIVFQMIISILNNIKNSRKINAISIKFIKTSVLPTFSMFNFVQFCTHLSTSFIINLWNFLMFFHEQSRTKKHDVSGKVKDTHLTSHLITSLLTTLLKHNHIKL